MCRLYLCLVVVLVCDVICKPMDSSIIAMGSDDSLQSHHMWKRFINPWLSSGDFADGISKIRTRRSYDECEKLQLCKLHARASRNFVSAFELYFVNKENARLWDHRARSPQDCERRFSGC